MRKEPPLKRLNLRNFGRKIALNFGEDLFFFRRSLDFGKNVRILDFGRKITLNFGVDLFFFFFFFFFLEITCFGRKKRFNFRSFRDISSQILTNRVKLI